MSAALFVHSVVVGAEVHARPACPLALFEGPNHPVEFQPGMHLLGDITPPYCERIAVADQCGTRVVDQVLVSLIIRSRVKFRSTIRMKFRGHDAPKPVVMEVL